ncbi:hypothetical protein AKJ62_02035 [candidate division MSBL1 archaeon SCGC-AAA259D14]|uniref:Uncharacterized protein n=1 Tax=candidate division MSBL1 archaeon SCGC-AAA259D14 TaxID=1698261 RepID=A0A133U714_9EURY|nr:hypothetical protein AKJ62_02035 [candidate division MSBL1 archaeon SCGC-AAA259D14]
MRFFSFITNFKFCFQSVRPYPQNRAECLEGCNQKTGSPLSFSKKNSKGRGVSKLKKIKFSRGRKREKENLTV